MKLIIKYKIILTNMIGLSINKMRWNEKLILWDF